MSRSPKFSDKKKLQRTGLQGHNRGKAAAERRRSAMSMMSQRTIAMPLILKNAPIRPHVGPARDQ
jgi:hypothetical protein